MGETSDANWWHFIHELFIFSLSYGPRQANLVLIAYASSEGSGEPAHPRSLARTSAARSYKQWVKRNLQTESQIPGPSEWLGMRSYNLSWRNARRHKFAWRGPYVNFKRVRSNTRCQHYMLDTKVSEHLMTDQLDSFLENKIVEKTLNDQEPSGS